MENRPSIRSSEHPLREYELVERRQRLVVTVVIVGRASDGGRRPRLGVDGDERRS